MSEMQVKNDVKILGSRNWNKGTAILWDSEKNSMKKQFWEQNSGIQFWIS